MNKHTVLFTFSLLLFTFAAAAEQFVKPLWPSGKTPDFRATQTVPSISVTLPTNRTSCAMLIAAPGGSYQKWCGWEADCAKWFQERGLATAVLTYRTPRPEGLPKHQSAWQDAQRAVRIIRANAEEWCVDPEKIVFMGFSAGGNLTIRTAVSSQSPAYAKVDDIDDLPCHVNGAVACYPAYILSDCENFDGQNRQKGNALDLTLDSTFAFDAKTPPMCLLHGDADGYSPMGSVRVYHKLRTMGVPAELHTFAERGHANLPSPTWEDLVWQWLVQMKLVELNKSQVEYRGNLPKFVFGGKPEYPFIDICGCSSTGGCGVKWVDDYVANATRIVGPRVLQMGLQDTDFLKPDGSYDWSILDRKAKASLKLVPGAKLFVNIRFVYEKWAAKHPDEAVVYAEGPAKPGTDEYSGMPVRPSAASKLFQAETVRALDSMAEYVKSKPWADRVVGIRLNYGVYTEWHTFGMMHGPDVGKAMTAEFRKWLKAKYGTDAALQKAWGDVTATLETANVPTMAERTTNGGFLLDPVKNRKAIDYYECSANVNLDFLLKLAHEAKKKLPGRLVGAYYGYVNHSLDNEGATFLLDKALSSPDIDFLSDPPAYTPETRLAGGDYAHRTIPASFHRYGKACILEDDFRFHYMTNFAPARWCAKSYEEDAAAMRRNIFSTLFDRCGYQICDPIDGRGKRPHSFDNPKTLKAQKEAFDILHSISELPNDSGLDTAVIVNYRDKFYVDTQSKKLNDNFAWKVSRDALRFLRQSGAVFDLLSLDDLLASKKLYKHYIFMDAYALSDFERDAVRRIVRRSGVTTAWFIAPGAITESGFSDSAMSNLVGMELKGASSRPDVICTDDKAKAFADGWSKILDDGSIAFFCPKILTTASAFRSLTDLMGAHGYVAPGSFVRRYGDYLMVHVSAAGSYAVTLPEKESSRTLMELPTGVAHASGKASLASDGAATWLFRIVDK